MENKNFVDAQRTPLADTLLADPAKIGVLRPEHQQQMINPLPSSGLAERSNVFGSADALATRNSFTLQLCNTQSTVEKRFMDFVGSVKKRLNVTSRRSPSECGCKQLCDSTVEILIID